jgi:isochorismate hydrolase
MVKASPPHQRFFQNESGAIHADLAPAGCDLVITKSRVSAFAGTDLDLALRARRSAHSMPVSSIRSCLAKVAIGAMVAAR